MTDRPRRRFQPRLWPSLAALSALAILLGLGTWQVQRLDWKAALIAEMQARGAAQAIDLPRDLSVPDLEYRKVRLRGTFLHDRELYLSSRTNKGKVGLHVVTPMHLDNGRTILVDRGWVPPERKDPAARAEGQVAGPVALEGVLRRGGWGGSAWFQPANQPAENLWLWLDLPAMAARAGVPEAETAAYVAAGPAENPGVYPIGGTARVDLSNNHLQYAITWYALAAILLVIYVLHQSRPVAPPSVKDTDDARL
jgi:surfeit locus 1 family protein